MTILLKRGVQAAQGRRSAPVQVAYPLLYTMIKMAKGHWSLAFLKTVLSQNNRQAFFLVSW